MATTRNPDWVVRWPTLGFLGADWIEQHCCVPDRAQAGDPFTMYDWQLWCTLNHYRVKPKARIGQLAPAFFYRRSQIVGPQKTGKGPWAASIVCLEAVGPAVFDGWAQGGEIYDCAERGCGCGWTWEYEPGDPMGARWPTPMIQLTASSEDQVANVYRPLKSMIRRGPLSEQMKVGEGFVRILTGGEDDRIDPVTSSATSRLGNPIIFAVQDETGVYTKSNKLIGMAETQRRGAAGMGGRTMETTNAWDPSEQSTAQRTYESKRPDIFKFYVKPPKGLSYLNKRERRRIHRHVYAGCAHVDLDGIEAEAAELIEKDPGQAERFYGNRVVSGAGSWVDVSKWDTRAVAPRTITRKTKIVLGFDGADVDDWTAFRAETGDGYQFTPTYGPDRLPTIWNPADYGGQVPRLEVAAALAELIEFFDVVRVYADPPYWETEIDQWVDLYGDKVIISWYTRRLVQMHEAAERLITDITKAASAFSHDGCGTTSDHVANTRKSARPNGRYVLAKASDAQKIDCCVSSILAHEAAGDATAANLFRPKKRKYVYTSSS